MQAAVRKLDDDRAPVVDCEGVVRGNGYAGGNASRIRSFHVPVLTAEHDSPPLITGGRTAVQATATRWLTGAR